MDSNDFHSREIFLKVPTAPERSGTDGGVDRAGKRNFLKFSGTEHKRGAELGGICIDVLSWSGT